MLPGRGWSTAQAVPHRGPSRSPSDRAETQAWVFRYGSTQATEQAVPLRVNEAGLPVLPVWVAWKPMPTDAFGAMAAL